MQGMELLAYHQVLWVKGFKGEEHRDVRAQGSQRLHGLGAKEVSLQATEGLGTICFTMTMTGSRAGLVPHSQDYEYGSALSTLGCCCCSQHRSSEARPVFSQRKLHQVGMRPP